MLFLSKITILHILDHFGDHTTKKKMFVTGDVTNFSPIKIHRKFKRPGKIDKILKHKRFRGICEK